MQRRVILEELQTARDHPTAVAVYDLVRRRLPKISLGTVYRNLELLSRGGMIQKLQLGGAEARFDADVGPHHHVRCVRCGRVDDIHDLADEVAPAPPKRAGGYEILGCRLEFDGICPDCKSEQPGGAVSPTAKAAE